MCSSFGISRSCPRVRGSFSKLLVLVFLQGTILEMWRQGDLALQDYACPQGIQMPQIYGVLEISFQRNREQPTWPCIPGAKKVPPRSSLLQSFFPSHFLGSGFVFFRTPLQMWFKGAARGRPFCLVRCPTYLHADATQPATGHLALPVL